MNSNNASILSYIKTIRVITLLIFITGLFSSATVYAAVVYNFKYQWKYTLPNIGKNLVTDWHMSINHKNNWAVKKMFSRQFDDYEHNIIARLGENVVTTLDWSISGNLFNDDLPPLETGDKLAIYAKLEVQDEGAADPFIKIIKSIGIQEGVEINATKNLQVSQKTRKANSVYIDMGNFFESGGDSTLIELSYQITNIANALESLSAFEMGGEFTSLCRACNDDLHAISSSDDWTSSSVNSYYIPDFDVDDTSTFLLLQGMTEDESGNISSFIMEYGATSIVPIPASAWLFGSGLLGLIGVARRQNMGQSEPPLEDFSGPDHQS